MPVGKGQAACGLSLVFDAAAGLVALVFGVFATGAAALAGAAIFLLAVAFFAGTVVFLAGVAFLASVGAFLTGAAGFFAGNAFATGAAVFLAGAAFLAGATAFLAAAGLAAGAACLTGVDDFLAGAATGLADATAFLAGVAAFVVSVAFLVGAAAFTGAAFLIATGALAVVALVAGAAFFTGAFFAVAIVFSLVEMQRALYANDWAQSDSCCWVRPSTVNRLTPTRCAGIFCVGLVNSVGLLEGLTSVYKTAEGPKKRATKSDSGRHKGVIKLASGKTFLSRGSMVISNP